MVYFYYNTSGANNLKLYEYDLNKTYSQSTWAAPLNSWFRLTIVYDTSSTVTLSGTPVYSCYAYGNDQSLYLTPGSSASSWTFESTYVVSAPYQFGKQYALSGAVNEYFNGSLSNVMIFDKAILEQDLRYLCNNNSIQPSLHPYVVAHYPLDQSSGDVAEDVVTRYDYSKGLVWETSPVTGDWTVNATTATVTSGSDSDGTYVMFTFPNASTQVDEVSYVPTTFNALLGQSIAYEYRIKLSTNSIVVVNIGVNNSILNNALNDSIIGTNVYTFKGTTFSDGNNPVLLNLYANPANASPDNSAIKLYYMRVATALQPNHATLYNFSPDSVGSSNQLLQSSWQNFYDKKKTGQYFLKFNGVSGNADVPSLVNHLAATEFMLTVAVTPPLSSDLPNGNVQVFFNTCISSTPPFNNLIILYWSGAASTISLIGEVYDQNGTIVVNINFITINRTDISTSPYVIVLRKYPAPPYIEIAWYLNGVFLSFNGGSGPTGTTITNFQKIGFGYDRSGMNPSNNGIAKAIMYENSYSDRALNMLSNCLKSDDYKTLSGILFDLDFGSVYQSAGTSGAPYYVADESGNDNYAELYNWDVDADQPLAVDSSIGLPARVNALSFVSANNHYLHVPNFNPVGGTAGTGHTLVVGYALDTARGMNVTDTLFSIRDAGSVSAWIVAGEYTQNILIELYTKVNPGAVFNATPLDFKTGNDGLQYYAVFTKNAYGVLQYLNGVRDAAADYINGGYVDPDFSAFSSQDLYIGSDLPPSAGRYLGGFMSHLSFYTGQLTQTQITNLVNGNTGNYNALSNCQLYLNFEKIYVNGSNYTLKDWSPQNRTVSLVNYTLNEVTPSDPSYRLTTASTIDAVTLFANACDVILSSSIRRALVTLVNACKAANVWHKMRCFYPFVGGTVNSHKLNLKNPSDSDEAFRLTFNGTWTHDSNGVLPDGTTAYADTHFFENLNLVDTFQSFIGTYSRTNSSGVKTNIGAYGSVGKMALREYDGSGNFNLFTQAVTNTAAIADSLGWIAASKKDNGPSVNSGVSAFKRNVQLTLSPGSESIPQSSPASCSFYIGAFNQFSVGAVQFSDRQLSAAAIGDYLTDAQMITLANIVEQFQVNLGRNA